MFISLQFTHKGLECSQGGHRKNKTKNMLSVEVIQNILFPGMLLTIPALQT